jgi:hypothetical protein
MRSILEQAVIHHLNGDAEQAQELMHQFIVARARQIHESMRNGEDPSAEGFDQEVVEEEYFSEADMSELTDGEGEEADANPFGAEAEEGEADDANGMGGNFDVEEPAEMGGEEAPAQDVEERMEDLLASLEGLADKFEEMLGQDGGLDDGADEGDQFGFDAEGSEPEADDAAAAVGLEDDMGPEAGAEDEIEEGFDDLAESVVSELEKINIDLSTDGKEIAAGKTFAQQGKSTLPQKSIAARQGGEPVRLKSTNHVGFERETAPGVKDLKKRRNNVKTANSALSSVAAPKNSKEGSEVGVGGKTSKPNTRSPLSGLKK